MVMLFRTDWPFGTLYGLWAVITANTTKVADNSYFKWLIEKYGLPPKLLYPYMRGSSYSTVIMHVTLEYRMA